MHVERSVIIPELVFRDILLPAAVVLEAHGINPRQPYTHEAIVAHGAPAHLYIQPPRPPAREDVPDING